MTEAGRGTQEAHRITETGASSEARSGLGARFPPSSTDPDGEGRLIRVLLADDHALVRAGIRSLLQGMDGIEVVGEASDGREAVTLCERERPDVLVVDIAMPEPNGLEVAARLRRHLPDVRVIVLSMHLNEEYVLQALRAGVAGYILKGADAGELEAAIRAVNRGQVYLTPAVSGHVIEGYLRRSMGETPGREGLTPRQRAILQLVAEGNTTKEIARRLGVSVKTVDGHRTRLMRRLNVHDVAGLVRYAIRVGLISPDP